MFTVETERNRTKKQGLRLLLLFLALSLWICFAGCEKTLASSVKLTRKKWNVLTNSTNTISLQGVPSNAKVKWSCSTNGLATMKKISATSVQLQTKNRKGTVKIRAKYRNKTYNCTVNIMTFSSSGDWTIGVGGSVTLKFSKASVKWSSQNSRIASVNTKGKVTGKKAGSCDIYARIGEDRYRIPITVRKAKLSATSLTIPINTWSSLSFNVPQKATFKAGNSSIVRISAKSTGSVYVLGQREGTTTITAVLAGKKYSCKVRVTGDRSLLDQSCKGLADGLYTRMFTSISGYPAGERLIWDNVSYRQFFFIYHQKAYMPYELPKSVEISLLKKEGIFAHYFTNYVERYRRLYSDTTIAGLMAVSHFMHDLGLRYTTQEPGDPIFGLLYQKAGKCYHFANTMQYLCYLADVKCAVVLCSYENTTADHDVNAVYYQGAWYFVEPQDFMRTTMEYIPVDYFGRASFSYLAPQLYTYANISQNKNLKPLPSMSNLRAVPAGASVLQSDIRLAANQAA